MGPAFKAIEGHDLAPEPTHGTKSPLKVILSERRR